MNARDRIGKGPWYNAKGVKIADNGANLHSDSNNLKKETALDERATWSMLAAINQTNMTF